MTENDVTPMAWIGCLRCYNEGLLVGEWYDAATADEVTPADVHGAVFPEDTHDELWVFDHEGLPVRGEMDPLAAAAWGKRLDEVDASQRPALCAWVESGDYVAEGGDGDLPSLTDFEERYAGHWDSFRAFAEQLADDLGLFAGVSDEIARHFDWDSWAGDLEFDYTVVDAPAGVFVFRSF